MKKKEKNMWNSCIIPKINIIAMNVQKIKILMIGKENILAGNKIAGLLVIAEKLWNKYKV